MEGLVDKTAWIISARFTAAAMLAVFMLLGLPLLVSAAETGKGSVIINEVMWAGSTSSTYDEWLELYNTTSTEIALDNWTIENAASDHAALTLPAEAKISAGGYYLIANFKEDDLRAAFNTPINWVTSNISLLNDANGNLVLRDATREEIDYVKGDEWPAGKSASDERRSMERHEGAVDGLARESWYDSTATDDGKNFGTPGAANSPPKVNSAPQAILNCPDEALVAQEIEFSGDDSSDADGDELTYAWSFSDGTVSASSGATHTFTTAGTYEVTLTVSDGTAENKTTRAIQIISPNYSQEIVINELLPNPVGSDTDSEFIEIKNKGSASIDLGNWRLDDSEGGSAPYTFPAGTVLSPGSIKAFYRSDTKIALNNDGDTVRLLDPTGDIKSSFTYSSSSEGQSFNRSDDGSFQESSTTTGGAGNVITQPVVEEDEETEETGKPQKESTTTTAAKKTGKVAGATANQVDLQDIRQEEEGSIVTTIGTVSVPPGVFGKTQMYLAGSGIQVYLSSGDFPALKLGDTAKLTGALSSNRGEARLKLASNSDLTVLTHGDPPTPHLVATGDVDEELEGFLVTVQGKVTSTSGDTFFLDDGSGEVKIYLKETTGIDKPSMKKDLAVTITGIVSETTSGYRILPRFQEDVRLGLVAGLISFPATGQFVLSKTEIIFIVLVLGYLLSFALLKHEPLLVR